MFGISPGIGKFFNYEEHEATRRKPFFFVNLRALRGKSLLLFFLVNAQGNAAGLPTPVEAARIAAAIDADGLAVYVQRVDQPSPLLAYHADRPMNPASVMKIVTTYAGLELLGPAYQWPTDVYVRGRIEDGRLRGDLIFKGHGDPKLTLESFWMMLRDLRLRGLRDLHGNVIVDRSYFQLPPGDPGTFDGERLRAYNALPDAFLVNFHAHRLRLAADTGATRPGVVLDPPIPGLRIVNNATLTRGPCGNWREDLGIDLQESRRGAVLTLSGRYASGCKEKTFHLLLRPRDGYLETLFRELWQGLGGTWRGRLMEAPLPATATRLASFASPPLADVVRDINKFSNNVMARQLFLTLGAQVRGVPGTPENASAAIHDWLAAKGLDFIELVLENGAGLSRVERISARHLGVLLQTAFHSPVAAELMSSFPIVATDGTMKKRLLGNGVAGNAHIKSGSLRDVRSIAGYVLDAKARRWVVVCIINDPRADAGRPVQDALLEWVYAQP